MLLDGTAASAGAEAVARRGAASACAAAGDECAEAPGSERGEGSTARGRTTGTSGSASSWGQYGQRSHASSMKCPFSHRLSATHPHPCPKLTSEIHA